MGQQGEPPISTNQIGQLTISAQITVDIKQGLVHLAQIE